MGVFESWTLASALSCALGLMLVFRLKRGFTLSFNDIFIRMRSMISSLAGNHFINLGGLAPMYLLPVFVTARLSAADNAYFYTTWMMGLLFFTVSASVSTSLYAEGSRYPEYLAQRVRLSVKAIAVLLAPLMFIFLVGGRYILAVFGPAYAQHGPLLLALLVVSAIPDAITNIFVSILRVRQQLTYAAILNVGMAAVTLSLAWILLPYMGIAGAGAAWLCGQTTGSVAAVATWLGKRRRALTGIK